MLNDLSSAISAFDATLINVTQLCCEQLILFRRLSNQVYRLEKCRIEKM